MSEFTALKGQCIAEFMGTALFIMIGVGCVAGMQLAGASLTQWDVSVVWGLGVAMAVYLVAGISGAHLNPAVTIALWLFGRFNRGKVLPYILSQISGAFCGALLVYILYYNLFQLNEVQHHLILGTVASLHLASIFSTYPHAGLHFSQAFMVEFTISAILVGVIFALTDDQNGVPRGALAPLLIGFLVAIIGVAFGPLTGFAMNPARDLGPKLLEYLIGWGKIAFTGNMLIPYFIVPLCAPILGGLLGGMLYSKVLQPYLTLTR